MNGKHAHITTLDTLRGIASLCVCLCHITGVLLPAIHVQQLDNAFFWGWAGVEMFFVISGFVIAYILFTGQYQLYDFWRFIGKRAVRICPPMYAVILLIIGQYFFLDNIWQTGHHYLSEVSPQRILYNATYTVPFVITRYPWFSAVFWTLAVEFQFYIFISLLFPIAYKKWQWLLLLCAIMVPLYFVSGEATLFLRFSSYFMMGSLATLYFLRRIPLSAYLISLATLSAVMYFQQDIISMIAALGTALIISFLHINNKLGRFLGRISYSLYLTHTIIAPAIMGIALRVIPANSDSAKAGIQAICLAGCIAAAHIFYLLIERPFIRLSGKLFGNSSSKRNIQSVHKMDMV